MNQHHQIGTTCVWFFCSYKLHTLFFFSFHFHRENWLTISSVLRIHTHARVRAHAHIHKNDNNNKKIYIFFIHFNLLRTNFKLKVRFIWPYNTCFVVFVYFVFFRVFFYLWASTLLCAFDTFFRCWCERIRKKTQQIWGGEQRLFGWFLGFFFYSNWKKFYKMSSDFWFLVTQNNSTLMSTTPLFQIIFFFSMKDTHSEK